MTDKEKIRAKIEKLCEIVYLPCNKKRHGFKMGFMNAIDEVVKIIDSMEEEPVSEDLNSFAIKYAQDKPYPVTVCQAVKVGANWQLNKIRKENEKNRD